MKHILKLSTLLTALLLLFGCETTLFDHYADGMPTPTPTPEPEPTTIPDNEIWYTSTDGKVVTPNATDVFGASIISNTYSDGKGVIKFSSNVTSIGTKAFYLCRNLKSITIPNSVTEIGEGAFSICSSLTSITIPNSVTEIGEAAFSNCSSLTSITIPNSITSIGQPAFSNCSSLAEFNGKFASTDKRCLIVDGVLNSFAPYGLTEYKIPDSVTTIGSYVFYSCSSLKSITIGNSVTEIGHSAFWKCSSLTSITIPNSVTKIGGHAFNSCSSLTSITIPNSVTEIEEWAFYNCRSLKSIYCKPTTPPTLGDSYVFDLNASGRNIYVPSSSVSTYKSAQYWREYADAIVADPATEPATIPNNEIWYTSADGNVVYPYAKNAFGASIVSNTYSDGKGIIIFSGNVTKIGDYAFFYTCTNLTSITIPDSVTEIGISAFSDCSSLTSITIPNSITSIGQSAFFDCSSLTSITIPNSVTEIGKSAFTGCSNLREFNGKFASADKRCLIVDSVIHSFAPYGLTNYTIPNSVTEIGDYAFYKCSSLTSITIPNSVTSIREYAFRNCSSLISVSIGNSVTSIESSVFLDCSSLKSITIPNSVISIGICAFKGCSDLTSITIPNSVTSIGYGVFYGCSSLTEFEGKFATTDKRCLIVDGVLISFAPFGLTEYTVQDGVTKIETDAFRDCSNLTRIVIPNTVTRIGGYTFYNCSSLTSITIPNSVTKIGGYAFYSCSSLKSVYCKPTTPPTLGSSYVFDENASGRNIYVPSSSVSTYKSAQYWSEYADAIVADPATEPATIPNNEIWYTSTDGKVVDPYATNAFGASIVSNTYSDGKGIIKFSGDVTTIGDNAFRYCRNLTSITIPDSVTSIGFYAFGECYSLTNITIPNSVTEIGKYAFYMCSSLTSITIPDGITSIEYATFDCCSNITSATIPDSVTSIGVFAFSNCSSLTSVTIPDSVTKIEQAAFSGCSSLTNITIPDSVISIGLCAFGSCSSLYEFNGKFASADKRCLIVDGVLNSFAPYGLTEYKIPDSVTTIGDSAFYIYECSSLTSITIPDSVTTIGSSAFRSCSSLTSITIPNSITSIGLYAFNSCSSLKSITIPDSVTKIGHNAFYSCTSLKSVYCKPTAPPTLGNSSVFDSNASDRKIYVPSASVDAYKTANNWSEYADYIVAEGGSEPEPDINVGGFDMVFVAGGTFTMGATAEQGSDADSDEKPTHSVTVSDFYIGKYEVTQAQWRAVMGSNPSNFTGDNNPVEKISWDDIQEFIKKLNAQTGKRFRLPTEAEWEYAARGGNQSKGYKYSGSNSISDVAWYDDNSSSKTHPVGQKTPNELGIYDMSGNVCEWCQDWYGSYGIEAQTNPTGPSSGSYRVLRGGSWDGSARLCRVSNRSNLNPDRRIYLYGFRLVMEP